MSERGMQLGDSDVGTYNICGQTLRMREELSEHPMDAHPDEGPSESSGES